MKISIVGLGLIGGSIAQGLKSKHQITGFDPDKNTQDQATKSGINIALDLKTCVKDAELVIVAAPFVAAIAAKPGSFRSDTILQASAVEAVNSTSILFAFKYSLH